MIVALTFQNFCQADCTVRADCARGGVGVMPVWLYSVEGGGVDKECLWRFYVVRNSVSRYGCVLHVARRWHVSCLCSCLVSIRHVSCLWVMSPICDPCVMTPIYPPCVLTLDVYCMWSQLRYVCICMYVCVSVFVHVHLYVVCAWSRMETSRYWSWIFWEFL
jgi:hypothetical protein